MRVFIRVTIYIIHYSPACGVKILCGGQLPRIIGHSGQWLSTLT
jgi:hypothetical protein